MVATSGLRRHFLYCVGFWKNLCWFPWSSMNQRKYFRNAMQKINAKIGCVNEPLSIQAALAIRNLTICGLEYSQKSLKEPNLLFV